MPAQTPLTLLPIGIPTGEGENRQTRWKTG